MAKVVEWTPEQRAAWDEWLSDRPQVIKDLAEKYPPYNLYRMGNHRVTLYSYSEDGTVTVNVTGEYNRVLFSRQVFGVDPSRIVECDLPAHGEDLGDTAQEAGYTDEDIQNILIPKLREYAGFDRKGAPR